MKIGYYLVIIAGGGGETVLYYDGEQLLAHGAAWPIDMGYIEFISKDPISLMDIPGVVFVNPFDGRDN